METQADPTKTGHVPTHVFDLVALSVPGGRAALADFLGVTQAAIGNWRLRGAVPVEHCAQLEIATKGRVTRRDLRPADWARIWPELAGTTQPIQPAAHPQPAHAAGVSDSLNQAH